MPKWVNEGKYFLTVADWCFRRAQSGTLYLSLKLQDESDGEETEARVWMTQKNGPQLRKLLVSFGLTPEGFDLHRLDKKHPEAANLMGLKAWVTFRSDFFKGKEYVRPAFFDPPEGASGRQVSIDELMGAGEKDPLSVAAAGLLEANAAAKQHDEEERQRGAEVAGIPAAKAKASSPAPASAPVADDLDDPFAPA